MFIVMFVNMFHCHVEVRKNLVVELTVSQVLLSDCVYLSSSQCSYAKEAQIIRKCLLMA
jgi:hypothetical protein